jgi:hypothetical protein
VVKFIIWLLLDLFTNSEYETHHDDGKKHALKEFKGSEEDLAVI